MMKKLNIRIAADKGQSLVEFALTVTVIMLLIAGIFDLGRAFFTFIAMRDGAQEAAVYAIAYPNACNRIRQRAVAAMPGISYDVIEIKIGNTTCPNVPPPADACAGQEVKVTIRDDNFPITMPLLGTAIGRQTISLKATITDTILRPPCP